MSEQIQLFDFQKKGVQFALENEKVLLADDMGLGKTLQAVFAVKETQKLPCLVIAPKAVISNWKNEIQRCGFSASMLNSKFQYQNTFDNPDFYIINYDIVTRKLHELLKIPYQTVILDEIHYAKNYKAKRTKSVEQILQKNYDKKLKKDPTMVIGLSGTPILNHGTEIHQIAKLINPYCLGFSFFTFAHHYCTKGGFGQWELNRQRLPELNDRLQQIMIRRKKNEVLQDLPDKMRSYVELEVNHDLYTRQLRSRVQSMKKDTVMDSQIILGLMSRERKVAGMLKTDKVVEFLKDRVDETDEKIVVFAHHTDVIREISYGLTKNDIPNSIYIGEMSEEQRSESLQKFKEKNQVIIISIHAGGTGINLQFANYVVFAELDWSPSQLQQAEDRCHRIGQKNNVTVYYLFAKGTIDENITSRVVRKMDVINAIIDDIEIEAKKDQSSTYSTLLRSL